YAVQVLGIAPQPELYLRPGVALGIQAANVAEKGMLQPAVLISEPLLGRNADADNAFDVAKKLTYFRPERYVFYAMATLPKIEAALEAAFVACGLAGGKREPEVEKLAAHLKRVVPPAVLEHVSVLARKHPGNGAVASSVAAWVSAADLTANRVGLIL